MKNEIEKLVNSVQHAYRIFQNCEVSTGYCMCGDSIESHSATSGHSPVDIGSHSVDSWLKDYTELDSPRIPDVYEIALAINGPYNAVPEGSKYTLKELREYRWENQTTPDEKSKCLWAAKSVLELFGDK